MEKISPILARKQHHFNTIHTGSTLKDALNKMNCENTGCLVVLDDDENFLGLLSEHEIASKGILSKKPADKIRVDELMNTHLPIASSDDTVERCLKLMCQHHVHQLPVFDDLQFRGIISADDLLHEVVVMRSEVFDDDRESAIY